MTKGASIGFYGGVEEVTGANFVLRTGNRNCGGLQIISCDIM